MSQFSMKPGTLSQRDPNSGGATRDVGPDQGPHGGGGHSMSGPLHVQMMYPHINPSTASDINTSKVWHS